MIFYLLPVILSILPIFMINWCAKNETEYPNIKIDTPIKKILFYGISLCILEIVTASFFIFKNNYVELIFIWIVILLLSVSSYIDWNTSLIPNRYSYSLIIVGFISIFYNIVTKNIIFIDYTTQIISFFIIFVSFVLIFFISKNGLGMGDVKIISACSIFIGAAGVAIMLFISSAGIIIYDSIVRLFYNKKIKDLPNNDLPLNSDTDMVNGRVMGLSKINEHIAIVMGPFLSVAFILSYLFKDIILDWWFI